MKISPLHLLLTFLTSSFVFADDTPKQIQVEVEMIELSEAAVTTALHGPNPPKSGIEWRALTDKLLKEKQAAILSSLTVMSKSGQRATADSAKEIIYATEYDPTEGRAANAPAVPEGITGIDVPTPTAFEMRPLGSRMELEPTLGADGKNIDLAITCECSAQVGETIHQEVQVGEEMKPSIKQPTFHVMKLTTAVTILDGSTVLLGILIPKDAKGDNDLTKRVICLARATVVGA